MAIPQVTMNRNKQSPIILWAIVIFGIVAGYLYYSQVLKQVVPLQPPTIPAGDTLAKFKDVKFDFSIFNDARFKALQVIGEYPVQPGATGKADLFAPF